MKKKNKLFFFSTEFNLYSEYIETVSTMSPAQFYNVGSDTICHTSHFTSKKKKIIQLFQWILVRDYAIPLQIWSDQDCFPKFHFISHVSTLFHYT